MAELEFMNERDCIVVSDCCPNCGSVILGYFVKEKNDDKSNLLLSVVHLCSVFRKVSRRGSRSLEK